MEGEAPKPSAILIYSERDELLRQGLADYLLMFQERGLLGEVRYYCLETFGTSRLPQLIGRADIFLFVYSVSLMAHLPPGSPALDLLVREHKLNRLKLVALLARAWDVAKTPFQNALALPEGERPILSAAWSSPHEAYEHIFERLEDVCREMASYRAGLDQAWQEATARHEVESYHQFKQAYPYSRHVKAANAAINRLNEDELWQEAQQRDQVEAYAQYLIKTPLREHVQEASNRISEIEEDEGANWAEAQKLQRAEFFFRYKAAFVRGNYHVQADAEIQELLSQQVPIDGDYKGQLESNYLMHQAYKRLQPEANFALESYLKYAWGLRFYVERLARNHGANQLAFLMFYALALIAEALVLRKFGFFWGEGQSLGMKAVRITAILIFNFFLLRQMYWSLSNLSLDVQYLQNAQAFLRRAMVQLKTSFLANDLIRIQQLLNLLAQTEQRVRLIDKKSILQYFLSGRPAQKQAEIREDYAKPWVD